MSDQVTRPAGMAQATQPQTAQGPAMAGPYGATSAGAGYWPAPPGMGPQGWGAMTASHSGHGMFNPYPYPYGPSYGPGWGTASGAQPPSPPAAPGLLNNRFIAGMLAGGALTYVLTNEAVQSAVIRGVAQLWLSTQGGWEETKERFRDAESEIRAAHEE